MIKLYDLNRKTLSQFDKLYNISVNSEPLGVFSIKPDSKYKDLLTITAVMQHWRGDHEKLNIINSLCNSARS